MMTLIAAAPNTPAEPIVEAINAILDIYADAGFDYDEPVFVRNSFLAHLSKSLPNFRSMVFIVPPILIYYQYLTMTMTLLTIRIL